MHFEDVITFIVIFVIFSKIIHFLGVILFIVFLGDVIVALFDFLG